MHSSIELLAMILCCCGNCQWKSKDQPGRTESERTPLYAFCSGWQIFAPHKMAHSPAHLRRDDSIAVNSRTAEFRSGWTPPKKGFSIYRCASCIDGRVGDYEIPDSNSARANPPPPPHLEKY